jgi:transposase
VVIAMTTPMPEPVRRIEVITGADRRRMWSEEEKSAIVAECLLPGRTVSSVARAHGLQASQLFGWRRALRKRAKAPKTELGDPPAFVPAVVTKPARTRQHKRASSPAASQALDAIIIEIGGAVVRIGMSADAKLVSAVLAALAGGKRAAE